MRVKIEELQEGCILSEDVFSWTNRPIIPKKTVLSHELIRILQVFLIPNVVVDKTLVNGLPFIPNEVVEDEITMAKGEAAKEETFTELFLHASKDYKKEFKSWQSGLPLDISKVRNLLLPLIEKLDHQSSEIFKVHHLSTKDEYQYQHSVAVGLISAFIGKKLNYNKGDIVQVALAGCLSDCGMAKVPPQILNKKTSLTVDEFEEIKQHPIYGFKMVQSIQLLRDATKLAILQHHERLDGSGYPSGEKDGKIHQYAKIIAIADTFHALTSERLYRSKQSPFKVLEMIIEDNFGKFDIASLKALQSGIMNFSIGTKIKLSDGQVGEILFIDEKSPTRPLIKKTDTGEIIHLEKNRDLFIDEVLQ